MIRVTMNNVTAQAQGDDKSLDWLDRLLSFPNTAARFSGGPERIRVMDPRTGVFPAGFTRVVYDKAQREGVDIQITDTRVRPHVDPGADLAWLRDYQRDAVAAALRRTRGYVHAPTASGKTEVAAGIIRSLPHARLAFLVHRTQLADQTAKRFNLRIPEVIVGIVGDGRWEPCTVTVATFQTLWASLRTKEPRAVKFLESLDALIVDECFPGWAKVGVRPISEIRVGDLVPSYDETTKTYVERRVKKVWVTPARQMVRVTLADGRQITSTPGHPFLTPDGWVTAGRLSGQSVLSYSHDKLWKMRSATSANPLATFASSTPEENLLPRLRLQTVYRQEDSYARSPESCPFRADESAEPHDAAREYRQDGSRSAGKRELAPAGARWQRDGAYGPTAEATRSPGGALGVRVGYPYRYPAALLQGRPGSASASTGGRGRRRDSQDQAREGAGCQEGPRAEWVRVESIEVLEPRDPGERDRLCPGGVVYNLHVEGTETYLVDGVVTHNCHTLPARTFSAVLDACTNAYFRVGLSGTPVAGGGEKAIAVTGRLGPVVYRITPDVLIAAGLVARPTVRMVSVHQKYELKPAIGRYAQMQAWKKVQSALIVNSRVRNDAICRVAHASEKPCMVFVQSLKHGANLAKTLRHGGLKVEFVEGRLTLEARNAAVKRLERGDSDVLVATVVFNEGVDIPCLRSVVVASGGKSPVAAIQRVGRGMRISEGKSTFDVWDLADEGVPMLERHTKERVKSYKGEGYAVEGAPIAFTK